MCVNVSKCVCVAGVGGQETCVAACVCMCFLSLSLFNFFVVVELDLYGNLSCLLWYPALPWHLSNDRVLRTEYVPYRTVRWLSKPRTGIIICFLANLLLFCIFCFLRLIFAPLLSFSLSLSLLQFRLFSPLPSPPPLLLIITIIVIVTIECYYPHNSPNLHAYTRTHTRTHTHIGTYAFARTQGITRARLCSNIFTHIQKYRII